MFPLNFLTNENPYKNWLMETPRVTLTTESTGTLHTKHPKALTKQTEKSKKDNLVDINLWQQHTCLMSHIGTTTSD